MTNEDIMRQQNAASILMISYEYEGKKTTRHRFWSGLAVLCVVLLLVSDAMSADALVVRGMGVALILTSLGWFWSALLVQKRAAEKLEKKHPELV